MRNWCTRCNGRGRTGPFWRSTQCQHCQGSGSEPAPKDRRAPSPAAPPPKEEDGPSGPPAPPPLEPMRLVVEHGRQSPKPCGLYKVVQGHLLEVFQREVIGYMVQGWRPIGGICAVPDERLTYFYQAMVK